MLSTQSESTMSVDSNLSVETASPVSGLNRIARRVWEWMSPFRIWREVRLVETARRDFAAGLAIGVFIACVPLYGFQTILGLFAARRLSLHPLPILAGTQLSAPPFAPALTVASVVLGHAIISGKLPHLSDWHIAHWPAVSMATVNSFVASWLIGGVILGAVLAGITYVTTSAAMRLVFRGDNSRPA
jgi:uncharacterized protein (DUF2062 family)